MSRRRYVIGMIVAWSFVAACFVFLFAEIAH